MQLAHRDKLPTQVVSEINLERYKGKGISAFSRKLVILHKFS